MSNHKRSKFSLKIFFWCFILKHRVPIFYASILTIAIIILIPFFTYIYFASDLKDKASIVNTSKTGLTLLDRENKPFFTFFQAKTITYIPLSDVPAPLQQAAIASEDKNFYTNPGFSFRGILRAFLANLLAHKIVEGGSTITQELVKNALLNASKNYLRKYQEVVLAYELNRRYSKKDILEMYLNSVYFGEGAFGIENAALAYFGVHAKDLDLAQSALLIGLLPAPSSLSPLSNDPTGALHHQHQVLTEMAQENYITQAQADAAAAEPLTYHPVKQELNTLAPHFALYVKDQLIQKYGEERIIRDGFSVQTTLNSNWQEYAENAVHNQVQHLIPDNASNGAAIALDPRSGQIEVMVGSEDWSNEDHGKTNMAITPRQPGSSFKPVIYADALGQRLITPATILHDSPTVFPDGYKPNDYDRRYRGHVTVRRALANSLNIPAVEVMQMVGVPSGVDEAQRLGITTLKDPSNYGLSMVLGAAEVKLLDLTDAYAVFADQGLYNQPVAILQINDKYGKVVDKYTANPQTVLDDSVAYLITSILSDNKARAEEFGGLLTINRPAAVKTGTTEDFRDALTIGYTPSLVVGVWVGNNDNTTMDNIAGSLGAAPIWRNMMETFLMGLPVETFPKPASITTEIVCPYNNLGGMLATSSAYQEFFIEGTQPSEPCFLPSPSQPTQPPQSPTPTNKPEEPTQSIPTEFPTDTVKPTDTLFPTPTLPLISPTILHLSPIINTP